MSVESTPTAAEELELFDPVPPGLVGERRIVTVTTTHLQMFRNQSGALGPTPTDLRILRAEPPSIGFYRYLYDAVGARWHWYDRKRTDDAALAAIIYDPRVEIHVAYHRGSPVGYVELDRSTPGECEIGYFGLVSEAIGLGLGVWFLRWSVHHAWRDESLRRLWVHTCSLDHASALPIYQKVGFLPFEQERHRQYIVVSTSY